MKKSIVVMGLLAAFCSASIEALSPFVESCKVIKHDGDTFTYNGETMKDFDGYELRCDVYLGRSGQQVRSYPIQLSDLAIVGKLAKALKENGFITLTNLKDQLNGEVTIEHDNLTFIPTNHKAGQKTPDRK